MTKISLTNSCPIGKDRNTYKTAHESLCAKLKQACAIANVTVTGNPTEKTLFEVIWGLSDLLNKACEECERLKPSDLISD